MLASWVPTATETRGILVVSSSSPPRLEECMWQAGPTVGHPDYGALAEAKSVLSAVTAEVAQKGVGIIRSRLEMLE